MRYVFVSVLSLVFLGIGACKPPMQETQGSEANSVFGVGGSTKPWITKCTPGTTSGLGRTEAQQKRDDALYVSAKSECEKFAQGLVKGTVGECIGKDVYAEFRAHGGCGLVGCNPKMYSFEGTLVGDGMVSDGGTSTFENRNGFCQITPSKKPQCKTQVVNGENAIVCCDSNGKNCART